jgi:hypothetical protein
MEVNINELKTIKHLLVLLKKEFNHVKTDHIDDKIGLCICVHFLYKQKLINTYDVLFIRKYMAKNRPKHYDNTQKCNGMGMHVYWFHRTDSVLRNKWLDEHIKLNS